MRATPFILLALFLTACTTIEITEQNAFDNHATITPEAFRYDQYTLQQKNIETEDGELLNSWFLERPDAQATVIYFGGNGFLMVKSRPLISAYSEIPVNLILFDYRGYGASTGNPTVQGVQSDAEAIYNETIRNLGDDTHPVYLHGHSMGSFLATRLAGQHEVAGYILESPITEVRGWTRKLVPWIARPFVRFDIDRAIAEQNNLERVSQINQPLLIISGTYDDITPLWMAEEIYEASASQDKELVKIAGGSHNDLTQFSIYQSEIKDFLMRDTE
jgi:uncharacterized protein